jgi:hypothetical protein
LDFDHIFVFISEFKELRKHLKWFLWIMAVMKFIKAFPINFPVQYERKGHGTTTEYKYLTISKPLHLFPGGSLAAVIPRHGPFRSSVDAGE